MSSKISDVINKIFLNIKKLGKISLTRFSFILGIIITAALYLFVFFYDKYKTTVDFTENIFVKNIILIFPLLIGLSILFKLQFRNEVFQKKSHIIFFVLSPFYTLVMSEILNNVCINGFTTVSFIGGYILILIFNLMVFSILGSIKLTAIFVNIIIFLLSLVNFYIFKFRRTPFLPMDFYAARTGINVFDSYDYSPTAEITAALFMLIFIVVIYSKMNKLKYSNKFKISSRAISSVVSMVFIFIFFFTDFFNVCGVKIYFGAQDVSSKNNGYFLNFVSNIKYITVKEPDNYSNKDINSYISDFLIDSTESEKSNAKPNVICIMNEALSDLSVLGDFSTNQDYMPFLRNLTDNTVRGNLYVPIVGGGTANSEFEFLTGHSMAFLPSGSFPYVSYVKNPISSLVSTLKSQGYTVSAFHPYYASGWSRIKSYGNFGFDKFISIEDIFNKDFLTFAQNASDPNSLQDYADSKYPQYSKALLRQYVNDEYNYKILINDFENRDKTKPYFMFNVTMQNHGSYFEQASNFDEDIVTISLQKNYEMVNKYLSLIKRSDLAFKGLIDYFSKVSEPTVICMFGDHLPALEREFFSEITNASGEDSDIQALSQGFYCTPFYIWANYDIEEKVYEGLSSNYLSSLLLDIANIKMPIYNEYLLELSKELPVICSAGYIDKNGEYYSWSKDSEYTHKIENYKKIQYNNLFDQENVDYSVFYINDYQPSFVEYDK